MTIEMANHIVRQTFETLLLASSPVLIVSLIVGLAISVFQAVTQLQEMTITFVPKIVAVFLTLIIAFPWMMKLLMGFMRELFFNMAMNVR